MKNAFLTFRSVTFAQRGEAVLRREGIGCLLQRTPKQMEELGCGYCLRMEGSQLRRAALVLREAGVSFKRGYIQQSGGKMEEVLL